VALTSTWWLDASFFVIAAIVEHMADAVPRISPKVFVSLRWLNV
jgi:hypothetical protein